jgi:hypothetical protein
MDCGKTFKIDDNDISANKKIFLLQDLTKNKNE